MTTFGQRLLEERKLRGLSQRDFGAFAGVTKLSQLNYEKDLRSPDTTYLQALAEHGVDVCYLLTGKRTETQISIEAELEHLADAWEAIDQALDEARKHLPANKKRQAAKALYLAFKEGEIQDFNRGANLLLAAA